MSETDHRRWKDDVAAYALGALDAGEAAELERHMEGCADCRAELRWLQPAVDLLPERVERAEAPPQLRAKIVEQVRSEPAVAAAEERQMPLGRRRLRGWRPAVALGAVALLLAAVAGYAVRGGDPGEGSATTVAAGKPPAVTAKLVMPSGGDSATLRLANVDSVPKGKVLEAWVQRDGEVTPVRGLFVPDREGRAAAMIPDVHGAEAVMVTAEPQGGSETPTGVPMVTLTMPE